METPSGQAERSALQSWRERNARYQANGAEGDGAPGEILSREGSLPVVLSAPHSVRQRRDGEVKLADRGTGGLAEVVAEQTGAALITARGRQSGDPNWDESSPYRTLLCDLAEERVVLDLHGMRDEHGPDICIGTGPAPCLEAQRLAIKLSDLAQAQGFTVSLNDPFPAAPCTLTAAVQSEGKVALQLELASRLRDPKLPAAQRTLSFLEQAVAAAATIADGDPGSSPSL